MAASQVAQRLDTLELSVQELADMQRPATPGAGYAATRPLTPAVCVDLHLRMGTVYYRGKWMAGALRI